MFRLLGAPGRPALAAPLRRRAVVLAFDLSEELQWVMTLMQKYSDVPMSSAYACLLKMTEG